MFRHVVLFKWIEGVRPEQVEAVTAALLDVASKVPGIHRYEPGPAVNGTFDYAIVADFDDEAGWRGYDEHPEHVRVRDDLIRPLIADRAAVRYVV